MSKKILTVKIFFPVVIILLGVGLGTAFFALRPEVTVEIKKEFLPLVEFVELQSAPYQMHIQSHGHVRPSEVSILSPAISGKIIWKAPQFNSGGIVEKDSVLLKIDPSDYDFAITQAKASVAQAKLALGKSEVDAMVATENFTEEMMLAASPLRKHTLQMDVAKANLAAAEASLKMAQLNLSRTQLIAPFDGKIKRHSVAIGQQVGPGSNLAELFPIAFVEVALSVPDFQVAFLDLPKAMIASGDLSKSKNNSRFTVASDFAGKRTLWDGELKRLETEVDKSTRTVTIVGTVKNPYSQKNKFPLNIGQFVDVDIEGQKVNRAFIIPRESLYNGNEVFLVDDKNTLHRETLDILSWEKTTVVVDASTSILRNGDRICTTRLEVAIDGMSVRLKNEKLNK